MVIDFINIGVTLITFAILVWIIRGLKETVNAQEKTISAFRSHIDMFDVIAGRYKKYVEDFHQDLSSKDAEIESLKDAIQLAGQLQKQEFDAVGKTNLDLASMRVLIQMVDMLMRYYAEAVQVMANSIMIEDDIAYKAEGIARKILKLRDAAIEKSSNDPGSYQELLDPILRIKKDMEELQVDIKNISNDNLLSRYMLTYDEQSRSINRRLFNKKRVFQALEKLSSPVGIGDICLSTRMSMLAVEHALGELVKEGIINVTKGQNGNLYETV